MGFLFSSPKVPAYVPPPAPPPPAPAPATPAPTPVEETSTAFSQIPLDADLPQTPEEVEAKRKAVIKTEEIRKRRGFISGLRTPINPALASASTSTGVASSQ